MSTQTEVPYLEDWITPGAAASMLSVSKQTVHSMMATGAFVTLHQVGTVGPRPFYVMRADEVQKMSEARQESFIDPGTGEQP